MILAIDASKVTAGEKDRSGASCPGNTWFFPKVKRCPRQKHTRSGNTAETGCSVRAGGMTFSGTDLTKTLFGIHRHLVKNVIDFSKTVHYNMQRSQ
jgi:hypothetical protein